MSNGYSKEKADRAIVGHDEKAAVYTVQSRVAADPRDREELERKAAAERGKAENLRELERHWGDTPAGPRRIKD